MATSFPQGLQDWYLRSRDGEWDLPGCVQLDPVARGWAISVDLTQSGRVDRAHADTTISRTVDDWLHAWIEDERFRVDCGPLNLTEAIRTYLEWAGWLTPGSGTAPPPL